MFLSKEKNARQIISWSFYDFANQPYTTLIISFIYSAFFVNYIAPNEQDGTFLWANAISITAICVALISPLLGAFADNSGYRKFFLIFHFVLVYVLGPSHLMHHQEPISLKNHVFHHVFHNFFYTCNIQQNY